MTVFFVGRHRGALQWAKDEGIAFDESVDHLDARSIRDGDVVVGTLPVQLAAEVCERGGRYMHLSIAVPPSRRGSELSAEDMRAFGASVEEYRVVRCGRLGD